MKASLSIVGEQKGKVKEFGTDECTTPESGFAGTLYLLPLFLRLDMP